MTNSMIKFIHAREVLKMLRMGTAWLRVNFILTHENKLLSNLLSNGGRKVSVIVPLLNCSIRKPLNHERQKNGANLPLVSLLNATKKIILRRITWIN